MKITPEILRNIIIEEMNKVNNEEKQLSESSQNNYVKMTPEYLNSIIKEEFESFKNRKSLAEAFGYRSK